MELNNELPKIKSQLEELEKRLNAINKSKAANEIINQINNTITQINQNISNAESEIDTLQTAFGELEQDVLDNTTNISTNSTNTSENQTAIQTLQNNISSIQTLINEVSSDLSQLESSLATIATTGDYNDLKNLPTLLCYNYNKGYFYYHVGVNLVHETMKHHFICNPDLPIYFKLQMAFCCGTYDVEYDVPFSVAINDEVLYSSSIVISHNTTTRFVAEASFTFFPTKEKNYITVRMPNDQEYNYRFYGMEIEMFGHNVFFLTRDNKWQINCYKDAYYVTYCPLKEYSYNFLKYKLSYSNHELSSENRVNPTIDNATLTKSIRYLQDGIMEELDKISGLGYQSYDNVANYYDGSNIIGFRIKCQELNISMSTFRELNTESNTSFYYTIPGICYMVGKCPIYTDSFYTQTYMTLNGQQLNPEWVDVSCVFQQDMTDEQYYPFRGCIILRDDGKYFFFPAIHSTYCVELGIGKNGHIFKRKGSENLYIYIGYFNKITQYILEKNQDGIYQVTNITTKYGYDEYIETQDNLAITVRGGEIMFIDPLFN